MSFLENRAKGHDTLAKYHLPFTLILIQMVLGVKYYFKDVFFIE